MKTTKLKIQVSIGKDMWMLVATPERMASAESRMKSLNRANPGAVYRLSQITTEILSEVGG